MRSKRSAKIELATKLLDRAANGGAPVVVAGTSYGSASAFLEMLGERDLPFVVQIRPSTVVELAERGRPTVAAADVLERGRWRDISTVMPDGVELECTAAKLASVALPAGTGRLFAAQIGGKCLCALGDFALNPARGTIKHFRADYEKHIRRALEPSNGTGAAQQPAGELVSVGD